MNISYLKELFSYESSTGVLVWKYRPEFHFETNRAFLVFNSQYAFKVAGCLGSCGYHVVGVDGKKLYSHRVCYALYHGKWPKNQIDHIDGDRTNNKISNLRDIGAKENQRNRRINNNNKTGLTGVRWDKDRGAFRATIKVNYKTIHLTYTDDFFEACCARISANNKYKFHENHGKRQTR
jgi:hypothetical protein